ncbi:MAG: hypothetical protein GF383_09485 [Candidatus Lokiarchaeota archaeon]|nr:hypothetical protein [Candidatus Lokiarchaeota archaeon]MBD3340745.1 hypothetical protein [Candidatus Lokiarchaeota archaeon]
MSCLVRDVLPALSKGEDKCPLKDDREIISKKLDDADGVIFATPVYSMRISYLLKP